MYLVSTTPSKRHLSYASSSSGGKTLGPGDRSPELALATVHNPLMLKDLQAGLIQLRLGDEDIRFLKWLLAETERPIKHVEIPVAPKAPKKVDRRTLGTPDLPFDRKAKDKKPVLKVKAEPGLIPADITPEMITSGKVSIAQLQAANLPAGKPSAAKLKEMGTFMKSKV